MNFTSHTKPLLNLFIVASPLQLLNAIEAKYFWGGSENVLLIKHSEDSVNTRQMEKLMQVTDWSKIIHLKYYDLKISFLNDLYRLRKLMKSKVTYDKLFMGDYGPINIGIFAANIAAKEIFLLDDGLFTIYIQKNYLHSNLPYFYDYFYDPLKRWIAKWVFGLTSKIQKTVHLFTCFSLIPHPGQRVIKNDYSFLKSIIKKESRQMEEGKIFFMGSPLVEGRVIGPDYFIKMMEKIKFYYNNMEIIYVPHRHESVKKLEMIHNTFGLDIMKMKNMVEIDFVSKKIIPSHIASFYSTALITLTRIYPDCKADAFLISMQEVTLKHHEDIKGCYEYLKEYVNVIDLITVRN